jgi:Histidine kinase
LARRVLAAADADRQRIERDLHDGVQQRLTGLRIRLAVAAESFQERGDTDASAALNGFGEEVQQAIEEVRAFARGVYPLMLASEGLSAALVSASRYAAAPVTVSARRIRRCRPEVESAVYFTCLAAIDNATKHAGPAQVHVRAWDTAQALHFTVCDTGCGFDPNGTPSGAGLNSTTASLPSAAPWPLPRDLRTERDYTAAFRTPGPAQPQNGDPPAIEPLRTPTSAASRHNPGPRDKATSAAGGDRSGWQSTDRRSEPTLLDLSRFA